MKFAKINPQRQKNILTQLQNKFLQNTKNSDSQNWTSAKNLVQHGMLKAKREQIKTYYSLLLILYMKIALFTCLLLILLNGLPLSSSSSEALGTL